MLSARQSAYCPTCQMHTSQERVTGKRGVRYCGSCGNNFTLKQSRAAWAALAIATELFGEAERLVLSTADKDRGRAGWSKGVVVDRVASILNP